MKRIICLLFLFILLCYACSNIPDETVKPVEHIDPVNSPVVTPIIPVNIIIDSGYLGYYDGEWHSSEKNESIGITQSNIPNFEQFQSKYVNKSTLWGYSAQQRLGTIQGSWRSEDDFNIFFSFDRDEVALALDADIDPLPKRLVNFSAAVMPEDLAIVERYLDDQNLDVIAHINRVVKGDFDGDGLEETLIFANTKRNDYTNEPIDLRPEEVSLPGKGVYSVAILVKNEDATSILSEIRTDQERLTNSNHWVADSFIDIDLFSIYDLNQDGSYEIVLQSWDWDMPQIMVYTFQASKLIPVLYANLAW